VAVFDDDLRLQGHQPQGGAELFIIRTHLNSPFAPGVKTHWRRNPVRRHSEGNKRQTMNYMPAREPTHPQALCYCTKAQFNFPLAQLGERPRLILELDRDVKVAERPNFHRNSIPAIPTSLREGKCCK
jgi:hypothetical protein